MFLSPTRCRWRWQPVGLILVCLVVSRTASADKIDDYVRQQMRLRHIPGLSLAVVQDGKIIKAKGYGLANVELNSPAAPDTVYQLASLTKQFTATTIMLLVQDGKISVEDKISSYVDGTPDSWKEITLRHLLTHTSGLKDYLDEAPDSPNSAVKSHEETTPEKIVQSMVGRPLDFAPGEKYTYSNTNYLLLSMVVRRAGGKPYDQFLAERVFQPLGMTATRLTSHEEVIPNRAAGYTWTGTRWRNSAALNPTLWDNGDGGMLSTVLDLAKWDAALYGETILTAASKQQMWTPLTLNDGKTGSYGFGWGIGDTKGHPRVWHTGGRPGTSTAIFRYLDDRLTIIVLANQDNTRCVEMANRLASFYVPAFAPTVYRAIRDTEPQVKDRVRKLMDGFAQGKDIAELLPPGIPVGVSGFPDPINSSKSLYENLRRLGPVRSCNLVERKEDGDSTLYRYELTYRDARLLVDFRLNKENKIVRQAFQIE